MLSIKHFVCCGMDVHKKFVVATIALTDVALLLISKKGSPLSIPTSRH